jgi:2-dehydro-3-deoxyphosphooctonate aldolase (KDO 8-P synthase)
LSIASVTVGDVRIGAGAPLALIAGPCVIESREHTLRLAEAIAQICRAQHVGLIFKASFDKANRSSGGSFRGPGLEAGLATLAEVRREVGVPILSDVHETSQAGPAGLVLDVIQIPAFLCRQTDLIVAAAESGRCINIKKGQFMSPEEMGNAVDKVRSCGNDRVLLTERGTFFGYNRLVNDMTAIQKMRTLAPVVFDATHSCQLPGGAGTQSGGQREFVSTLARAGVAAGADALFLEVHDQPDQAKSDPATVLQLEHLGQLLEQCRRIADVVRGQVDRR